MFSSKKIAVIVTYIDDYIFPPLLQEIQAVLIAKGFSVQIYSTKNSTYLERDILNSLLEEEAVAGIIVEGVKTALPNPNLDLYRQIQNLQMPLVFLHSAYRDLEHAVCISDDNYGGGYYLANYLLDAGHRSIGGIFKSDDLQGHQRYEGCISALREHECLQPDTHFLWFTTEDRDDLLNIKHSEILARYLHTISHDCTAIICYNDEVAYFLMRQLRQQQYRIPEDVCLVSFDNSRYADTPASSITSLGHTPHSVGRSAALALLSMISGDFPHSRQLPWQLFRRRSG